MIWMYQNNEMHCICFLQKHSHSHTHTRTNFLWYLIFDMCGTINFDRDVIWICKDRINTQISIVLFKHHIISLAQVDFCTLLNNIFWSSKREHIPHKNDTKWFGIKHSFIRCIIIHCVQRWFLKELAIF